MLCAAMIERLPLTSWQSFQGGGYCASYRHGDLLDAAHIHQHAAGGRPVVTNGLTLCKMHHAAYDRQILAVPPANGLGFGRFRLVGGDHLAFVGGQQVDGAVPPADANATRT